MPKYDDMDYWEVRRMAQDNLTAYHFHNWLIHFRGRKASHTASIYLGGGIWAIQTD